MDTNQLINKCKNYFSRCGYEEKKPTSLLHPSYPDTFNPCSGHSEITNLANSPELKKPVNWIALEPVFRHLDAQKAGVSKYHSSFFEMLTYVDARRAQDSSKEKIILELLKLYKELGIDTNQLHVTTFNGYNLLGKEIPPDEESKQIWTRILGKDKVHPLRSTSNIEFLLKEGEQAGPRSEIFLDRGNGLFEIGTVVFDNYIYKKGSFRKMPNSIYGGAGGIERLEMAVNGYQAIQEVGTIKPIINILREHSKSVGNLRFLEDELFTAGDNLKSALLITAEGQERTNKTRRGQRLTRLINDAKRSLERLGIQNYENLCSEIAETVENLYGERYSFYKEINPRKLIDYLRTIKQAPKE